MNLTIKKNWKTVKLREVGKVITGKTPSKENPSHWGDVLPFVTPTDFKGDLRHISITDRFLSDEGVEAFQRMMIPKNSVLVTCIGSDMGKVALVNEEVVTNQQINSLLVSEKSEALFIYYALKNSYEVLRALSAGGSTMPIINKSTFENLEIKIPESIDEQKEIAGMLGCLDDKIELLRKENRTLEEMAQVLFKEWFMNFKFPGATGRMIDSELGEIPEGWRVGKLGEVAFVTKGTTPTTIGGKFVDTGINFIKAESITEQHGFNLNKFSFIDEYTNNLLTRSVVQAEDILYTIAGTIGRFALVTKDLIPANTNQAVAIIRSNNEMVDPYYLKCYFDLGSTEESLIGSVVEAVQANLSLGSIKECKILIPSNIAMQMFREKIKPLFLRQDLNNIEIQTLSKLRDELLNKIF